MDTSKFKELPMVEVVTRSGVAVTQRHMAVCPFHPDRNPSMHVHDDWWYCYGCHKTGDQIQFVMEFHHLEFKDALGWLADQFGVPLEQTTTSATRPSQTQINETQRWLVGQLAGRPDLVEWLHRRGYTDNEIAQWGWGYWPKQHPEPNSHIIRKWLSVERHIGRLTLPLHKPSGVIAGWATRATPESGSKRKWDNPSEKEGFQKEAFLYGQHLADVRLGYIIVVEGYGDVHAVTRTGAPVVAVCGTAITSRNASTLAKWGQVVVMFDGDPAGVTATKRALFQIPAQTDLLVATVPSGSDPGSMSETEIREAIEHSVRWIDWIIGRVQSQPVVNRPAAFAAAVDLVKNDPDPYRRSCFIAALSQAFPESSIQVSSQHPPSRHTNDVLRFAGAAEAICGMTWVPFEVFGLGEEQARQHSPVLGSAAKWVSAELQRLSNQASTLDEARSLRDLSIRSTRGEVDLSGITFRSTHSLDSVA